MARKSTSRRPSPSSAAESPLAQSAQKIWLAGLGAYERAKSDGPRMFDVLVEQGQELRARARDAADQALKAVRDSAGGAGGRFDKLEKVFEDRVSKSLGRLGVLTRGEVSDLSRQVGELTESVRSLLAQSQSRTGAPKKGAKRSAKRSASAIRTTTRPRSKKRKAAKRG